MTGRPPVRLGEAQGDFVRALESRADEEYASPGSLESPGDPADRAIKRACARFFGALDAVQAAAEKEPRDPGADPGAVYAAYTARIADLTESLHRDRKRPAYAGNDPRADLREALTGLRRMAAKASHRHGASTADVYSEIAEQVAKVAAAGPAMPPAVGSSPGPEQPGAGQPAGPAVPSESPESPRETGAPVPGPRQGPRAIRRSERGDGPDFLLRLRLTGTCGMPHDFRAGAPVIVIYGAGDGSPQDRAAYEELLHGSFRRGGVYQCSEACGARHPALTVTRLDFPLRQETLLYVAPSEHKSWMLPDKKLIGVTRDMSPESISLALTARPPG